MTAAIALALLLQPRPHSAVHHAAKHKRSEPAQWRLIRKRIKHVFVLYQENRSFDHYFGTFPGAEGLFSHPTAQTPGFNQTFVGADGKPRSVHPFRIGPKEYASDTGDVDHAHEVIVDKMHFVNGCPRMDNFAKREEKVHWKTGATPPLSAVQYGELSMAYVDGDTIPFLWRWADRFVLCDHIFQTITGPSTPGNLTIIAAQTGVSQWIQHPEQALKTANGRGVPVENDATPFWGSKDDKTANGRMPYNPAHKNRQPQFNLTYPSLPLTLAGHYLGRISTEDRDPKGDLDDIRPDVAFLTSKGRSSVGWGWYEEGFDKEPTDVESSDPLDAEGRHASYVTHHNGPQYFGYVANNPEMASHLHGLSDFYSALKNHTLPDKGIFYVKGGYKNLMGMHPACPDPAAQKAFLGDDDHPGYSDAQISEAMVARSVNAIANSPYWKDSVIIITWDDSEGDYDHVRPPVRTIGPDGKPVSDGPRVPMIVISPYSKSHAIMRQVGDQASVVKFADRLFGLTPLADLPVERRLRRLGKKKGIADAGPRDDQTPFVCDLSAAFDVSRLSGHKPPLKASYAAIPESLARVLPQTSGYGLNQLGIVPTDRRKHIKNMIPADFNPRPKS